MARGFFITFEGLDGSGKTTQLKRLAGWLEEQGQRVVTLRNPGSTPLGDRIRSILLDSRAESALGEIGPLTEMALMFADRAQSLGQVVAPALESGAVVLCDRFTDSSEAYQGAGRGLGSERIRAMHRAVCNDVQPDLTVLLLPPLESSLARARRRNQRHVQTQGKDENRFESEGDEFYRRIYGAYEAIAARDAGRVVPFRDEASIEVIAGRIRGVVEARLRVAGLAVGVALCLLCTFAPLRAQQGAWQPGPGHTQMPIWPGTPPDAQPAKGPEYTETSGKDFLVAGRPATGVRNVSRPTMTVYAAQGKNTGAAVVVFPGGGYEELAIDLEGTEACDWLTSRGIACVLLKYRVPAPHKTRFWGAYPESSIALEDAQRALGLVRLHAAEWHIDPHKVGVLGFSAGGHLVAAVSVHFDRRIYPPVDAADGLSCRPDFAVAIYPGHLSFGDKKLSRPELNPDIRAHLTGHAPPTFILQNEDDFVDGINQSLVYYIALKNAGVPVEMHLYAQGGHAFGLRPTKLPVSRWPRLVETWLDSIGVVPE